MQKNNIYNRMQEGNTAVALAMVTPGYDQDPASGVADYTTHQDQAQFEADKRAVYKHPLFPLLALLFERCEQATQSSDNSTSESFNMDIQAFVQHQERDRKPFLINDPEIDGLVRPSEFLGVSLTRRLLWTICVPSQNSGHNLLYTFVVSCIKLQIEFCCEV